MILDEWLYATPTTAKGRRFARVAARHRRVVSYMLDIRPNVRLTVC